MQWLIDICNNLKISLSLENESMSHGNDLSRRYSVMLIKSAWKCVVYKNTKWWWQWFSEDKHAKAKSKIGFLNQKVCLKIRKLCLSGQFFAASNRIKFYRRHILSGVREFKRFSARKKNDNVMMNCKCIRSCQDITWLQNHIKDMFSLTPPL